MAVSSVHVLVVVSHLIRRDLGSKGAVLVISHRSLVNGFLVLLVRLLAIVILGLLIQLLPTRLFLDVRLDDLTRLRSWQIDVLSCAEPGS